jgi:RNA polymerase sigma factor (sigma-70 family)
MAGHSISGVVVSNRGERDRGSGATIGSGADRPASRSSGRSGLEETEHRAQIFRLVKELPEDQRRVVELRFAGEKSIREIARELGRSEGAVKQLQFRGLLNLRDRIGEKNG